MANSKDKKSLKEKASSKLKNSFDLDSFKKKKGVVSSTKFKELKWINFSEALQDATKVPGIPMGHISLVRGHSDTGKSTTLAEIATEAQKQKILPVFLITEMKFGWEYFTRQGFELEHVYDDDGNIIDHKGFFIYADRSTLKSIEDMASFIYDLLEEQEKGNLPFDLLFLIDSIGATPCLKSIENKKNNPMWNAAAYSQQFGNFINQKIVLSRKEDYPYTNSLLAVNKVWVEPAASVMAQPKMKNKGGDTMFYDCSMCVTFGNISNSGTSVINAVKDGMTVEYAKRTKIKVDKNHITGLSTKGIVLMTNHGFIKNTPVSIKNYKDAHKDEWMKKLGGSEYGKSDFELVEDRGNEWDENFEKIPTKSDTD
jgi:hypothetical protein